MDEPVRPRSRRPRAIAIAAVLVVVATGVAAAELIPGPPVSIEIAPTSVTVGPGATTAFRANLLDDRGRSTSATLTWSTDAGSIDATGTATATTKAGAYLVTVTTDNGLSAKASLSVDPGPPAAVEVKTPGAVKPSEQTTLSAIVRDSYGNEVKVARVSWSVTSGAATVDEDGHFRSRTPGTFTVEARSDDAVGSTAIVVVCPPVHQDAFRGATFSVVCGNSGDVWLAGGLTTAESGAILSTIDRDLSSLESDMSLSFDHRFTMYVYGSSKTFGAALSSLWPGASGDITGLFIFPDSIVVDWQGANEELPQVTVRHELAHLLLDTASGRIGVRELPAWFDEGLATVEQYGVAGSSWQATSDRYCAASAAANGTMPSLTNLESLKFFQSLDDRIGYAVGAQAVQFLRDDIGWAGLQKMVTLLATGYNWHTAYTSVTGKSWDEWSALFPNRLRALAPRYPGVAFATDTPAGAGESFVLYGYAANSTVRVNIENARFAGGGTHTMSGGGCYFGYLGSNWPAGTYSFTATGGAGTVSTTVRK